MINERPHFEDYDEQHVTKALFVAEKRYLDRDSKEYKNFLNAQNRHSDITYSEAKRWIRSCIDNNDFDSVDVDTYLGKRPVVMSEHPIKRMGERAKSSNVATQREDLERLVKRQLKKEILDELLFTTVEWDSRKECTMADNDDDVTAVAVIQEDEDVIPVYEAGQYVINVRTVVAKAEGANYFGTRTKVICADKDANIIAMSTISCGPSFPKFDRSVLDIAYSMR